MRRRVGDGVAAQQAMLAVDADVILVAEHRDRDLDLALVAIAWRGLAFAAALDDPAAVAVDMGRGVPVSTRPACRRP